MVSRLDDETLSANQWVWGFCILPTNLIEELVDFRRQEAEARCGLLQKLEES